MLSGILLLDKPRGLSSNAALQRVRSLLSRCKAGHVGSLDPLATGMLPVCLGEATKIAGEIIASRKRYRFVLSLGVATATGDAEGAVTMTAAVPPLERAAIEAVLVRFRGRQLQTPPMYSALKRDGQPLYRLARAGLTVAREAREVELFELELLALGASTLELEVLCSKGTYVRVLGEQLAEALGSCGHVSELRRLYVEPFADQPMQTLESLERSLERGAAPPLLPPDWPLTHLPAVHLTVRDAAQLLKGQAVAAQAESAPARVRLYDDRGRFLGLGETDGRGGVRPRRLLNLEARRGAR